jgi:flagellar biosynthesis chaperone FliJ
MAKPVYPLAQVLQVKKRRVENAEQVVKEKRIALENEQKKLKEREAEREKVKNHYNAKLFQMREEMDLGTTSPKIQQMKIYLKLVQEKLAVEDKKVKDQEAQVQAAEKNLELAIQDLKNKRQEVDKLETHQVDWTKEMQKELEVIEGREMDELGNVIFVTNARKSKSF